MLNFYDIKIDFGSQRRSERTLFKIFQSLISFWILSRHSVAEDEDSQRKKLGFQRIWNLLFSGLYVERFNAFWIKWDCSFRH